MSPSPTACEKLRLKAYLAKMVSLLFGRGTSHFIHNRRNFTGCHTLENGDEIHLPPPQLLITVSVGLTINISHRIIERFEFRKINMESELECIMLLITCSDQ